MHPENEFKTQQAPGNHSDTEGKKRQKQEIGKTQKPAKPDYLSKSAESDKKKPKNLLPNSLATTYHITLENIKYVFSTSNAGHMAGNEL